MKNRKRKLSLQKTLITKLDINAQRMIKGGNPYNDDDSGLGGHQNTSGATLCLC